MKKDLLIFNLNKALQLEYSDIFLYVREAKMTKDNAVSPYFEKFGLMEIRHADMLAQRILALGGRPTWDFQLLEDKNNLQDTLARHIASETMIIDFYGTFLEEVDDETKIILRGIRAEEETHLAKLKEFLKK
jgi:bacterioferritin (cytochrome b1)